MSEGIRMSVEKYLANVMMKEKMLLKNIIAHVRVVLVLKVAVPILC